MNAIKHSLRSETLALPHEDEELLRETREWWFDYYQPRTPGEFELLDIAVTATVQRRRSKKFYTAAVTGQVLSAGRLHDEAGEDLVAGLVKLLALEPDDAVRLLGRTAPGCRWLIARWERLERRLGADGDDGWQSSDCDEAIRLQGQTPDGASAEAAQTRRDHEALYPELAAFQYGAGPRYGDVRDVLLSPSWGKPLPDAADPAVAAARSRATGRLKQLIADRLEALRAREAELRLGFEEPERALAGDRALLLEGAAGSLWLRYERMHELAFHRAYKALLAGRQEAARTGRPPGAPEEADEADTSPEQPAVSIAAAVPAPAPPVAAAGGEVGPGRLLASAVAPNKANGPGPLALTRCQLSSNVGRHEDGEGGGTDGPAAPAAVAGETKSPPTADA